jgi:hypothetical protein
LLAASQGKDFYGVDKMKMTLKDKSPIPDSPMIEVIVRLKLPLTHYEAATELSDMCNYKHFDDFVSALIKEDIERE